MNVHWIYAGLLLVALVAVIALAIYLNNKSKQVISDQEEEIQRLLRQRDTGKKLITNTCECWLCLDNKRSPCNTSFEMSEAEFHRYDRTGYVTLATACPNFKMVTRGKNLTRAPKGNGWVVLEPQGGP